MLSFLWAQNQNDWRGHSVLWAGGDGSKAGLDLGGLFQDLSPAVLSEHGPSTEQATPLCLAFCS